MGRPPSRPTVWCGEFLYQVASWDGARRVVAKIEWQMGELFPRVGQPAGLRRNRQNTSFRRRMAQDWHDGSSKRAGFTVACPNAGWID